ncbi:DNA primase small subunit PriS [Salinarchaeum chitinilyticum]
MEERTRAYLRGRFRDHYRRAELTMPPLAERREWGYIPWSRGGTTMVRHQSLLELGAVESFLERERPRHVYFSAGVYHDPGADAMEAKGWRGSDLVFDLDADHLPGVDPETTSYADMLAACKGALMKLLSFLEEDFGFSDLTIAFSGGRGYHVHVRDEGVRTLDREARREIVDYVRGVNVDADSVVDTEAVVGEAGRTSPADKRTLDTSGGWSARVHRRVVELVEELEAADEATAKERLQSFEGIGEGRSAAIANAIDENADAIRAGNVDVHGSFKGLVEALIEETVAADSAPIDEPVTTDTHRLIRLPGSLHGGSGLAVTRIDREDLDDFDPLVDAVPETFAGNEITVEVTDLSGMVPFDDDQQGIVEIGGDSFRVGPGTQLLPEPVAIFLLTRDRAEKEKE